VLFHVLIVIVATILGFIFGRRSTRPTSGWLAAIPPGLLAWVKGILSVAIVLCLLALVAYFTNIAVTTAVREGAKEWHVQYAREVASTIADGAAWNELLERTTTYSQEPKTWQVHMIPMPEIFVEWQHAAATYQPLRFVL